MIATGTGITPFLSLIKEFDYLNKLDEQKFILLFGCTNKGTEIQK